jgi:starch phosphorylase
MKILVNGGLNLSELDGWWAEAYSPDVGWALGDGREHAEPEWDGVETEQLFSILEREVVPQFYERDAEGIPRSWVARIRASLSKLTPLFRSNRMLADYLERLYLPAAEAHWARTGDNMGNARSLGTWYRHLRRHWQEIHWGNVERATETDAHVVRAQVYLGEIPAESVRVQLYAEDGTGTAECHEMRQDHALSGAAGGFLYVARLPLDRADRQYTPRVVAHHPLARVPAEANFIRWHPH